MKKFKTEKPGRGGWSEWQEPIMKGYLMKCCDCSLIHEIEFKVLEQTSPANAKGEWKAKPFKDGRVSWRLRRYKPKRRTA